MDFHDLPLELREKRTSNDRFDHPFDCAAQQVKRSTTNRYAYGATRAGAKEPALAEKSAEQAVFLRQVLAPVQ